MTDAQAARVIELLEKLNERLDALEREGIRIWQARDDLIDVRTRAEDRD